MVARVSFVAPDRLYFTSDDEANALIARDPLALLVGFVLDQQVSAQTAFVGPLRLRQRVGGLNAAEIAGMEPDRLERAFRERPAIHRFPGTMARRVQELCAAIASEYGGDAGRVWNEAADGADLERRLLDLPGIGEMKVRSLIAILAKRYGIRPAGWEDVAPSYPTLGDVDSPETLERFQEAKRAYKAQRRARSSA
jgi:uncharacterized HhH-GPD family protein